jgi:hypothetical protein
MAAKKSNEPRTYTRTPVSFHQQVMEEARDVGMSIPDYLEGKRVVEIEGRKK